MIEIRTATKSDIPLILNFIKGLAEYERLFHEVVATEHALEKTLFTEPVKAHVLIAENDQSPIGFALYFQSYSTFLAQPGIYLEDLFVIPEARGLGAGKLLLKKLAQIAIENQCGRLEWSVLDWNKPAVDFYKKLNAKPQDEWTTHRLSGKALEDLAQGF